MPPLRKMVKTLSQDSVYESRGFDARTRIPRRDRGCVSARRGTNHSAAGGTGTIQEIVALLRRRQCAVPSGLASCLFLPGTDVPGYRLCRPFGTRPCLFLPGTDVPGYRLCRPFGTRPCLSLPDTDVPGYSLCRPFATRFVPFPTRH